MVVLGDVLHAEVFIGSRVVELGCINQSALHGWLNFATRQLNNRHTHFHQNVSRKANGTVLQSLHLGGVLNLFFEPA